MSFEHQHTINGPNASHVPSQTLPAAESIFSWLPTEIRQLIFEFCISPSLWNGYDPEYYPSEIVPSWYLSHMISPSLLQLNKQTRQEAFGFLAFYPLLTVACNADCEGLFYFNPGVTIKPPVGKPESKLARGIARGFGKVRKQCIVLARFRKLRLTIGLYADGEEEHNAVDEIEAVRLSIVDEIFLAINYVPPWRHVEIDLDGVDEMMRLRINDGYQAVRYEQLDEYLDAGWRTIVEEFRPLRASTESIGLELKGWRQDEVLRALVKDGEEEDMVEENQLDVVLGYTV